MILFRSAISDNIVANKDYVLRDKRKFHVNCYDCWVYTEFYFWGVGWKPLGLLGSKVRGKAPPEGLEYEVSQKLTLIC